MPVRRPKRPASHLGPPGRRLASRRRCAGSPSCSSSTPRPSPSAPWPRWPSGPGPARRRWSAWPRPSATPGFGELRDAARRELSVRLATDAVRARADPPATRRAPCARPSTPTSTATLDGLDPATLAAAVDLLDDDGRAHLGAAQHPDRRASPSGSSTSWRSSDGVPRCSTAREFRVMSRWPPWRRGDVLLSMDVPRHEHARGPHPGRRRATAARCPSCSPARARHRARHVDGGHRAALRHRRRSAPSTRWSASPCWPTLLVNGLVSRRRATSARRLGALERTWTTTGLFDA